MDQKRAQHRATSSRKIVAVDPATNGRRPAAAGRAHPPRGPLLAAAGQGYPPAAKAPRSAAPPLFPRTCRGHRSAAPRTPRRDRRSTPPRDLGGALEQRPRREDGPRLARAIAGSRRRRAPPPPPQPPPPRSTSPRGRDPPGRTVLELRPWSLRLAAAGRWQGSTSAYARAVGLHGRRRRRPRAEEAAEGRRPARRRCGARAPARLPHRIEGEAAPAAPLLGLPSWPRRCSPSPGDRGRGR